MTHIKKELVAKIISAIAVGLVCKVGSELIEAAVKKLVIRQPRLKVVEADDCTVMDDLEPEEEEAAL